MAAKKTVGGGAAAHATPATDKAKKPKGKSIYDYSNAHRIDENGKRVSLLDAEGKLTAIPGEVKNAKGEVVQVAYDPALHKPLGKKDFGTQAVALNYRALVLNSRIAKQQALATQLTERATALGKYKSEESRKKALRLDRLRKEQATLEAELEAEESEA